MYYPRTCVTNVIKLCKKRLIQDIKKDLRDMPGIHPIKSIDHNLKSIIKINTTKIYLNEEKINEIKNYFFKLEDINLVCKKELERLAFGMPVNFSQIILEKINKSEWLLTDLIELFSPEVKQIGCIEDGFFSCTKSFLNFELSCRFTV